MADNFSRQDRCSGILRVRAMSVILSPFGAGPIHPATLDAAFYSATCSLIGRGNFSRPTPVGSGFCRRHRREADDVVASALARLEVDHDGSVLESGETARLLQLRR